MARDVKVTFKLSENVKNELQMYSESYGVTMSSLVALIVGQWVHQQSNVVGPMIQEIGKIVQATVQSEVGKLEQGEVKNER